MILGDVGGYLILFFDFTFFIKILGDISENIRLYLPKSFKIQNVQILKINIISVILRKTNLARLCFINTSIFFRCLFLYSPATSS